MRNLVVLLIVVMLPTYFAIGQEDRKSIFYVGTFSSGNTESLYVCTLDEINGDVEIKEVYKGFDNPNYLAKSDDGSYLYLCLRPEKGLGIVEALKIDPNSGSLFPINKQTTQGDDPCYVDVSDDGKHVVVANYGTGNLAFYKVGKAGGLESPAQLIQHEGGSIDNARQLGPHAHSVKFSPFDGKVYAADLGMDKLMIYQMEGGMLIPNKKVPFAAIEPGSGPRHFEFHPSGKYIYVINELNSTVSMVDVMAQYKIVQVISTLPKGFDGKNYCADIHISDDGKYLYCSNRGHNSIATFSVSANGKLTYAGTVSTHGDWPRNFSLSTNGKFMLVANQNSHNITVYNIDRATGKPVFLEKEITIQNPVCIVF